MLTSSLQKWPHWHSGGTPAFCRDLPGSNYRCVETLLLHTLTHHYLLLPGTSGVMWAPLKEEKTQQAHHLEADLSARFHSTCLFQPEGLRCIPWERALQIPSPGHSPNPCSSLEGSGRQNGGIYRARDMFSTWIGFSDTFKPSLRNWFFNIHIDR